jgi:hypothetical protein
MFKDVFAGIESEGEIINDVTDLSKEQKITAEESQTEIKSEEEEKEVKPSQGGEETEEQKAEREKEEAAQKALAEEEENKLPFHKHPRFKALVDEKNAYKTKLEELEKFKEETETKLKSIETKTEDSNIPGWFVEIFGENPEAWTKYQEQNKADREALKAEVLAEVKSSSSKEEEALSEGKKYIDGQIDLIKEKGITFERNALMKAMNDEPIFDKDGNLDFVTKARLLELEGKKDPAQKKIVKKLISEDGTKGGDEQKPRTYKTPEEMRRMSWNSMGA